MGSNNAPAKNLTKNARMPVQNFIKQRFKGFNAN
jgi:hypothetical protein